MHDAARGVRQVADQRGVRVALGDVTEAPFEGDADLLGRLLLNLLDNAIKHSPDGGTVDVAHGAARRPIRDLCRRRGPGIPADAHERVFERFFRVDVRPLAQRQAVQRAAPALASRSLVASPSCMAGSSTSSSLGPGRTEFRLNLPGDVIPSSLSSRA